VGIFAAWQPQYAELGIATFPVREKKPAVKGYLNLGLRASGELRERFKDASAIGLACKRSGVTVLDVDSTDERLFADALDEFGPTHSSSEAGRAISRLGTRTAAKPASSGLTSGQ
jgi:hypothetical protein